MRNDGGRLILTATDMTKHVACAHITTLDLSSLSGTGAPAVTDDALNLIFAKGLAHEAAYLERLRAEGRTITEISAKLDAPTAQARTLAAMHAGAQVIYQAGLFDGTWSGRADFLLRTDRPSPILGDYAYDIADTKLARRLKVPALLQMAGYADRLAHLQGVAPDWLIVVTGDGVEHPWATTDVSAYASRLRERFTEAVTNPQSTDAAPVLYCAQCRWSDRCEADWLANDDVSQIAGLRSDQLIGLINLGLPTMGAVAASEPADLTVLSSRTRVRIHDQASLQVAERDTGRPSYSLLELEPNHGLQRLPEPDPADVYLDFEGDPWAEDGAGREYLAGLGDREQLFTSWWAHNTAEEKKLVADLIDALTERFEAHPDMHVYHYAPYEVTALRKLTGRYGTHEARLDALLRNEVFVDLYAVVRQSLMISKPSYSIKKLEEFYWGHTRSASAGDVVNDAMTSVVEYERYLVSGDQSILDAIEAYNKDDVESTLALHNWLEDRRVEAALLFGQELARFSIPEPKTPPDGELAEQELAERLLSAGAELLAGCVGWHRREQRQAWWDYYRYADLSDQELIEDRTAIGGLGAPSEVGKIKQSTVWRYDFPPQECQFPEKVYDVDSRAGAGTFVKGDPGAGWIEISRASRLQPYASRGFQPGGPIGDAVLRESIARTARAVLDGQRPLGLRLIDRIAPAIPDGDPSALVVQIGERLDGEILAVQGPPGTGKTYAAAKLIRGLLDQGKRVGVTAQSHAVVMNLLAKTDRPAHHRGPEMAAHSQLAFLSKNREAVDLLQQPGPLLIGGTSWLWADEAMADSVDVLIIDEAGQFSLANSVAVSQAARSLVLLGDPQQLKQPTQATHPYGAEVSALDHWLDGHETMPLDRGVFLPKTYRMHPEVTAFISKLMYEGRLTSARGRELQRIDAPGFHGAGLRWLDVEHQGRDSVSPEEAQRIAALVEDLLAGTWTDFEGAVRPLTLRDILVVAPYNAQVGALLDTLPHGARVGTVDKFQGQEAPVVIYSLTSSSALDAPRGVNFLYDLHRLNVAVSRAQAMAILVGNDRLLDAAVHSPEQLRSVNALCRYVETATS
ncbi:MAG: TM0106 family RecB-like putative nuclease [Antricoccus sp.]